MNLFSNNPDFYPTPNEVIEQMMFNQEVAKERGWSLPKKQTKINNMENENIESGVIKTMENSEGKYYEIIIDFQGEKIKEFDRDAKVVIISADIQKLSMEKALQLGDFNFVKKPIDATKMQQRLEKINKLEN